MVKKVYKTDLGSLVFVGFGILIFLAIFIFVFGEATLVMKIVSAIVIISLIFFLFNLLKYEAIISDDSISVKVLLLSFLNRYQTMKFEEIDRVYNVIGPYSDMQIIAFKSGDKSKKGISIMVGFGLPWNALTDILQHLPKNVEINFEPLLWKKIKKLTKQK